MIVRTLLLLAILTVGKSCVPLQKFEDDNMKAKIVFERKKEKFIDSIQKLFENKIKVLSKNNTTLQFQITKKNEQISDLNEQLAQQKIDFKTEQIDIQVQAKKDSTELTAQKERIKELTEDLAAKTKELNALRRAARSQGMDISGVSSATPVRRAAAQPAVGNSTAKLASLQAAIAQKDQEIATLLKTIETIKTSGGGGGSLSVPNNVNIEGVYYRIQATTIKNSYSQKTVGAFGDMVTQDGNLIKFIFGYFPSYEDAVEGRKVVLQLGFDRSWIVKYKNKVRIN